MIFTQADVREQVVLESDSRKQVIPPTLKALSPLFPPQNKSLGANPFIPIDLLAKKAHLDWLYYEIGNQVETIELGASYFNREIEDRCIGKWHNYLDLQRLNDEDIRFLRKADNRRILQCEIVADLDRFKDDNDEGYEKRFLKTIAELDRKSFNYMAYLPASKSYHIHIFIPKLRHYPHAQEYKEWVTEILTGDMAKTTKRTMIALENSPHWKTGRIKTLLINKNNGVNDKIPLVQ